MLRNPMHRLLGMKQNPLPADFVIGRRKFGFFPGISVVQCLVIRAKYIFFFQGSGNEELTCVKHCKCKPGERCQFKSLCSKRSGLFKKSAGK